MARSSTNNAILVLINVGTSFMCNRNSISPSVELCSIAALVFIVGDVSELNLIVILLLCE